MPYEKYKPFAPIDFKERTWPSKTITKAPIWCSVDLRDGNQALVNPMSIEQKLLFFKMLLEVGFKEIEVGFPAASVTEFQFMRQLVEKKLIPDDVTIQILCQARPELIDRSLEALAGCKKAIFHLYNSTSSLQRDVVFKKDRAGIIKIALDAIGYLKQSLERNPVENLILEYSPESFTGTELDFSLEISAAVIELWQPTPQNKIILNLPATVEMSTPNVYADMIEWIINKLPQREHVIVSLHTHNDRGTGVAATELALLAGAQRVEGTLFGNGERTGNVDIITLACNLYSQGIDPELDFTKLEQLINLYEDVTEMPVHPRHPYAGALVYTAFSGSHQDAIKKGLEANKNKPLWEVPYLPIDPADLGREYDPVRINSQSGKGGVAFVLEQNFGYKLPKQFHKYISSFIQKRSELTGKEVLAEDIKKVFEAEFVNVNKPLNVLDFTAKHLNDNEVELSWTGMMEQTKITAQAKGSGIIAAFCNSIKDKLGLEIKVSDYIEHTMGRDSSAIAASYVIINIAESVSLGVGKNSDTSRSAINAIVSAINNQHLNKFN